MGAGRERIEEALGRRRRPLGDGGGRNVATEEATAPSRSTSVPRSQGRRRRISARSAPVPPPTSTTVRTSVQPPAISNAPSGRPWPARPMRASKPRPSGGRRRDPARTGGHRGPRRRNDRCGRTRGAYSRWSSCAADAAEVEAERNGRLEERLGRSVQGEAAGRRLLEHAVLDQVGENGGQRRRIAPLGRGEGVRVGHAGRKPRGHAKGDDNAQAPGRRKIRHGPDVRRPPPPTPSPAAAQPLPGS